MLEPYEEFIDGWKEEYNIPTNIACNVICSDEIDAYLVKKGWAGMCREYIGDYFEISFHSRYKDNVRIVKGILWHEFCHLENKVKNKSKGHDIKWFKLLIRKPVLAIYGFGILLKPF